MADFYADIAQTAREIIEEFGREIGYAPRGTVDIVPGKPWRGVTPIPSTPITAAVFDAVSADRQQWADISFTKKMLVAAEDLGFEPKVEDTIEDEDISYRIAHVDKLKPGDTVLIYTLLISAKSS